MVLTMKRKMMPLTNRQLENRIRVLEQTLKNAAGKSLTKRERLQRRFLHHFLKGAWDVLEPSRTLEDNWHIELIAEYLEAIAKGQLQKALINIMPRSLKSFECSVCFPSWDWIDHPSRRFLCLSYSGLLSNDHNDLRRSLIKSPWYQRITYGRIILSSGATRDTSQQVKNRISEFANNYGGQMVSRGLDGSVTGVGGDIIIFDDPNNPEQIESEKFRKRADKRFRDFAFGRRNNAKTAAIVVVQQRTGRKDVSGVIIDQLNEGDWEIIKLPTCAKIYTEIRFPVSGKVVIRQPGDFLHPSRHGAKEDREAKKVLGSLMYSGRHNQSPIDDEGGIFPKKWYRMPLSKLPERRQLAISVDSTFGSTAPTASFVVVGMWAIARPNFICLDIWRERCGFNDAKKAIRDMRSKWHHLGVIATTLIEKKANGADIIEDLRLEFPGVIPYDPRQASKRARAEFVSPFYESGNVIFLDDPDAPWFTDYQLELESFPNEEDDQVDMSSQIIAYFVNKWRKESQEQEGATTTLNKSVAGRGEATVIY